MHFDSVGEGCVSLTENPAGSDAKCIYHQIALVELNEEPHHAAAKSLRLFTTPESLQVRSSPCYVLG